MKKIDNVDPSIMCWDFYKGNRMLRLGGDRRFPFQFGSGKAALLVEAIKSVGAERFIELLGELSAQPGAGGES